MSRSFVVLELLMTCMLKGTPELLEEVGFLREEV